MEKVVPNIIVAPFYVDEMVLVRLADQAVKYEKLVSPLSLDYRYELFFNWGPSYQIWHDRRWDTYRSSRLQVDAAALIFSLMWDVRQWAIVPKSIAHELTRPEKFIIQQLSDPPPPRVCYQLTHKNNDPIKKPILDNIHHLLNTFYTL